MSASNAPKPFAIGAKVTLTEEDEDVAPGSLGTVLSYTEEGLVEVDFPEVISFVPIHPLFH